MTSLIVVQDTPMVRESCDNSEQKPLISVPRVWPLEMATQTQPLLQSTVDGSVDYKGNPVYRFNSGGWRSTFFILGVEIAERSAYFGISSNLIMYLTGPLGQSMVTAAKNLNVWWGTAWLLPFLGAFVADYFLGRYRTIVVSTLVYILGLGLLTLSAVLPSLQNFDCQSTDAIRPCSPNPVQVVLSFLALYLVAIAQGGHRPCVQAFGADQFDGQDPEECKAKSSFFNWWNFCMNAGTLVLLLVLNYIQDNLGWGLGFGIPCFIMFAALVIFLFGTKIYRYSIEKKEKHAFLRIGRVFVATMRNWRISPSPTTSEGEAHGTLPHQSSEQFNVLNRALLGPNGSKEDGKLCSHNEVEEAKAVLRLVPIWTTCLMYGVVSAQPTSFFTKQAATMNRSISAGLEIPAASVQLFIPIALVISIPIYDRVFVPFARALTQKRSGITMLQRIGAGLCLSILPMIVAALVEMKRLRTAQEFGLVDLPNVAIPMSWWWLIPQNVLFGVSEVFALIGLQEFFYDQVPSELRSVGMALFLSILGVGNFLSSLLISAIAKATGGDDNDGWFATNLNRGHLDYFYWLLAGLCGVQLVAFLYFAKSYIYNRGSITYEQ